MTLGKKLIELRKKDNYTQEKLSEKLSISRQTLLNWENEITSPDINQAKKIAEIFKVSLDDLLDNNIDVECKNNKSVLLELIGCECYIDMDSSDYELTYSKMVKIIDIKDEFIKVQFKSGKKIITKLIDKRLITSIKCVSKEGEI